MGGALNKALYIPVADDSALNMFSQMGNESNFNLYLINCYISSDSIYMSLGIQY